VVPSFHFGCAHHFPEPLRTVDIHLSGQPLRRLRRSPVIPNVYNGKNKTFWFVAYEANKFGNPDSGQLTSTVPTAKMHVGDFSEYLALGATYQSTIRAAPL
jgi:hypothetical protein